MDIKIFDTTKKLVDVVVDIESDGFPKGVGNHYYVHFICPKCGKEAKKQARRCTYKPFKENFLCGSCLESIHNPSHDPAVLAKKGDYDRNLEKRKKTNLEKYGCENPMQNKVVQEKAQKTNIEKYGTKAPAQNSVVYEKMKATTLARYGVEHFSQTQESKESKRKKFTTNFISNIVWGTDVEPTFSLTDYKGTKKERYRFKCLKCGHKFNYSIVNGRRPICTRCGMNPHATSFKEIELFDFVKNNYTGFVEANKRFYYDGRKWLELDIYIKDLNLGIEFDGLFWHSEYLLERQGRDARNNQKNKHLFFEKMGIQVIHIFEDEWSFKKEAVKSLLLARMGVFSRRFFGRNCIIKDVSVDEAMLFLEDNHLQGKAGASSHLGLYAEEELVSILSVGVPRFNNKYDYEVVRFCNKKNCYVAGGFSKLLKHFEQNYQRDNTSIISYCDNRIFTGKSMSENGFSLKENSSVNYYYTDYKKRYNRMSFQKHKLEGKLSKFDPLLSEAENMKMNGFDKIYDCGCKVFIRTKGKQN